MVLKRFSYLRELKKASNLFYEDGSKLGMRRKEELLAGILRIQSSVSKMGVKLILQSHDVFRQEEAMNIEPRGNGCATLLREAIVRLKPSRQSNLYEFVQNAPPIRDELDIAGLIFARRNSF
tara:strand:- start:1305 stop:1670 length:366 start_codon:yes stop_codon:yes gene_type:complete